MGIFDSNGPGVKYRFAPKNYQPTDVQSFGYYSGAQITIWFGDIWVDDITAISWQYNQEKRPIYGYASQHFDAVAKGQVLVQGQLRINFRNQGYLSYIMRSLPRLQEDLRTYQSQDSYENMWEGLKPVISTHLKNGTFGPTTFQEILDLPKRSDFWQVSKVYEDAIWGELPEEEREKIKTPDITQQELFPEGFNILVTYGDPQAAEPKSINDVMASTTKSLIGVHLLGSSQVIEINGEPTQEMYTFMARDMDKYMGTAF